MKGEPALSEPVLPERLAGLVDPARAAWAAFRRKASGAGGGGARPGAGAAYLDCGRVLLEARERSRRGDWAAFLAAAGVHEKTARRMLTLAKSGLSDDAVEAAGGPTAALRVLAARGRARAAQSDTMGATHSGKATRTRAARVARRAEGRCLDCPQAAPAGRARCDAHAASQRRRRATAGKGWLARLHAAAQSGAGVHLTTAEAAEAANLANAAGGNRGAA